jgi:STAS-like domain of unknown function (DUF4325)
VRYDIYDITRWHAIAPNDGNQLHAQISPVLIAGQDVELDFKRVEVFATAFFNVAVGSLLKGVSINNLKRQLKITNLNDTKKVQEGLRSVADRVSAILLILENYS